MQFAKAVAIPRLGNAKKLNVLLKRLMLEFMSAKITILLNATVETKTAMVNITRIGRMRDFVQLAAILTLEDVNFAMKVLLHALKIQLLNAKATDLSENMNTVMKTDATLQLENAKTANTAKKRKKEKHSAAEIILPYVKMGEKNSLNARVAVTIQKISASLGKIQKQA